MIELLRSRRSIRRYTGESISKEHLGVLTEALLRSFSSRSIKPWEFVLVDDPALLSKLARVKPHGSSFVEGAGLAIVVCADEPRSDMWVEDCSIAATLVHLTAHSIGLGSCWVQIRMRDHVEGESAEGYIQDLLGIPPHVRVECLLAVGHPDEGKPGHPASDLDPSKIRTNRFS